MKKIIFALGIVSVLFSCSSDDDGPQLPRGDYEDGIFVLNEGNFGTPNASVSFVNDENEITNGIFSSVNSSALGNTAQSMAFHDDKAFIVLNGSNKIEVVNRYTFETLNSITTDLTNPRYIAFSGNKAYVTNWGNGSDATDDFVTVINLSDYSTSTISVVEGPEKILEEDGKLYVAHKGGFGYGNSVTVINASSGTVEAQIAVGDVPEAMVEEDDKIYVLCGGKPSWSGEETGGSLYMINMDDNTSEAATMNWESTVHPSNLVEEDDKFYFTVGNSIQELNMTSMSATELFTTAEQGVYGIYGFAVNDDNIYVCDPLDYQSNGKVYIYDMNGNVQHEYTTGVLPNGLYFND